MSDEKNEVDELDNEVEAFDKMEKDFQLIVSNLVNDQTLEKFRGEYEKLHVELVKSHNQNKQLIDKCRQLNADILSNANVISSTLSLNQSDARTIAGLRTEFEKAWKMVEISQERESKSKEVIETLKQEISNLSRLVEQGGALAFSQETSLQEMSDQIAALKKEITMQTTQMQQIRAAIDEKAKEKEGLLVETNKLKEDEQKINEEANQYRQQNKSLSDESESLVSKIKDIKDLIVNNQNTITNNSQIIHDRGISNSELVQDKLTEDSNMKVAEEDKNISLARVVSKTQDHEDVIKLGKKIQASIQGVRDKIEEKNGYIEGQKKEMDNIQSENQELTKILNECKQAKEDIDNERAQTRQSFAKYTHDLYILNSQTSKVNMNTKTTKMQSDKVVADTHMLHSLSSKEKQNLKVVQDQQAIITGEVSAMKAKAQEDQKKIAQIETETNNYRKKSITMNGNIYQTGEEIKILEQSYADRSKELHTLNEQTKRQVSLMEIVQNERDLACKQHVKAMLENEEIAANVDVLVHEIAQLKNDIKEADEKCVATHYKRKVVEDSLGLIEADVEKLRQDLKACDDETTQLRNKIQRSAYLLSQAELDTRTQSHTADDLEYYTRSVNKSTVEKVNEANILKEKANLLTTEINNGSLSFKKKMAEINQLNDDLKRELALNQRLLDSIRHSRALQLEIIRVEKALILEQGKSRALSEELERPINIHRWRILNGTNPELAQLIRMNHDVRDKLMMKINQLSRLRDTKSRLKDRADVLETHLKNAAESERYYDEFQFLTEVLQQKTEQLRSMEEQLNSQRNVVGDQKEQLTTVRTMVREEKSSYYNQKKKVVKMRAKTAAGKRPTPLPQVRPVSARKVTQFVGGGFAVTNANIENRPHERPMTTNNAYSPRKKKEDGIQATRLPSGWNSRRPPLAPYLPILSESKV
ncbi:hypothetical protein TVAG_351990 [Trichomonas vaginalis G3]|uniref:Cilia- and flagella-associated protein 58 central coiled coil domain-containing protein n=1 Tax=Trichomonas vaginalis (strain ATCC PRA-98 / G3) TaxID=412133 RepID=A2DZT3_TRIV3|nr:cilia- and flagella-associated protein 58-related family [Trichomonas vaginalis G3]EAY14151.1 hypothetical protein TVAG_351990 [Trichomonas vaginalis G3]KAI5525161.1 cilia- and flagella-associated protein 58-related family [Trichomonas vaginalis G3]|eukprot:XP_001326374.1 hypothetical protein [Trichomonas vaginalis G3]